MGSQRRVTGVDRGMLMCRYRGEPRPIPKLMNVEKHLTRSGCNFYLSNLHEPECDGMTCTVAACQEKFLSGSELAW